MKKYLFAAAASLALAASLAACGGGSSTPAASTAIAGKVADGYLVGASVFLDKNGNYRLDDGEPSATTDENGAYTLTVDPADVGRYHIVALAIQGVTVDRDTDQTVPSTYLLSLPKYWVSGTVSSNFISPMSTLLREMMETGDYATVQEAMEALRVKLGMPMGTDLAQDYIAGGNQRMHAGAQNMASLMGSQMAQVFANHSGARIDVNRYRGMMGMIFSNISTVKGADGPRMGELMGSMATQMGGIAAGQPFRNMSSMFHGGMAGTRNNGGGTMGGGSGGMTGSGNGGMMGSRN